MLPGIFEKAVLTRDASRLIAICYGGQSVAFDLLKKQQLFTIVHSSKNLGMNDLAVSPSADFIADSF